MISDDLPADDMGNCTCAQVGSDSCYVRKSKSFFKNIFSGIITGILIRLWSVLGKGVFSKENSDHWTCLLKEIRYSRF